MNGAWLLHALGRSSTVSLFYWSLFERYNECIFLVVILHPNVNRLNICSACTVNINVSMDLLFVSKFAAHLVLNLEHPLLHTVTNVRLIVDTPTLFLSDCIGGYYGVNCSRRCVGCANGSRCDRIRGNCLYGCGLGYKSPSCLRKAIIFSVS